MCPSLTDPNNGVITCSLGDDGVPSYEDTCSFTCNTGYKLTGSDTRTCQSDGSWSGSDDICSRGEYCVFILFLHTGVIYSGMLVIQTCLFSDNDKSVWISEWVR